MSRQQFALDYIDVATRIVEFREKHPEGSLQQVSLDFREVNGGWWVIFTAAAYRSPDDPRPGQGTAWEPIPGKTNFTRDNEVQNAETAAWGRAIVAAMAADTKRGIASAEEVRNSRERQQAAQAPQQPRDPELLNRLLQAGDTAPDTEAINTVWRDGKTAVDAHLITPAEWEQLKDLLRARARDLDTTTGDTP